eukprot:GFKZ01005009.1.p1 GENE.GFKZ01005009.1~~GFKZ01005009.1.p1  ORF type:complete len:844 (+),score=115.99 GFKZ01005009.1:97-2628(+)
MEAADHTSPITLPHSSQFDSPEFNPVTWLNASLPSNPTLPPLLHLLQDSFRDAHNTLDSSLSTALSSVPWVVRETEKVRQRANVLRAGVDGVGQRVEGVESGVISSVSTIAAADTVVRRVQRASDLLAQAVEAERLLARLDALLASSAADGSDLVSAADVVSKLRATLEPLKPIPELADRFSQLDESDRKLEALAAPQLKRALKERGTAAAKNARIVFDHAGRDNAFQTQYVTLRGEQVLAMWSVAWEARELTEDGSDLLKASKGDLAAIGAEGVLVGFYGSLYELIRVEAEWLREGFPDLREQLLPMLITEAVGSLRDPLPVSNVFVAGPGDTVEMANSVAERLYRVGLASVTAAGRICRLFLPDGFGEREDEGLGVAIVNAVTTLLQPFRAFWNSTTQVSLRQARTRASSIEFRCIGGANRPSAAAGEGEKAIRRSAPVSLRPSLGEFAKDVEACNADILAVLDSLLGTMNQRTCGVGIAAMKQTTNALATSLTDRLCRILKLPVATRRSTEDEWAQISGALRLLIAASSLKRSWDARKESLFAVAVGTATPVLETASVVQGVPVKRIEQFLSQLQNSKQQEAAVAWELVRDTRLMARVVSEFESLDSAHDFDDFINLVHRVVYDTMFAGVKERFSSFSVRDLWSAEASDGDANLVGFSSSPLGYATEVADFLMTIPQQIEPFVPDEEDSKYAAPASPYVFSKAAITASPYATSSSGTQAGYSGEPSQTDQGDELSGMSFAGMWISMLAIGTMELYVDKICSIPKMSAAGTRQLATDADYICNIIASLGVAPTAEMTLVSRLLECRSDAASIKEIAVDFQTAEQKKLIRKVAAVRGINVSV